MTPESQAAILSKVAGGKNYDLALKGHTLQGATPNASMIRGLLRLAPRIEPCSQTSLL
jgi:hypothetical protein